MVSDNIFLNRQDEIKVVCRVYLAKMSQTNTYKNF